MITKGELSQHPETIRRTLDVLNGLAPGENHDDIIGAMMTQDRWLNRKREPTAPTINELGRMVRKQLTKLDLTAREAAARAGISYKTLQAITQNPNQPRYSTIVSLCKTLQIDLSITGPDSDLPAGPLLPTESRASGKPGTEPPSPEELHLIITERLKSVRRILRGQRARRRILTELRGLRTHLIERIGRHGIFDYNNLRTFLPAIEIDMIIRLPGDPLPETLKLSRFTWNRKLPVHQLREHSNGTDIRGREVKYAPSPADLYDDDALYMIWPHEQITPAGITTGDYCLATPSAPAVGNIPVWVELVDGMKFAGIRIVQPIDPGPNGGAPPAPPLCIITAAGRGRDNEITQIVLPKEKVKTCAPIIEAYSRMPSIERPPSRRWSDTARHRAQ